MVIRWIRFKNFIGKQIGKKSVNLIIAMCFMVLNVILINRLPMALGVYYSIRRTQYVFIIVIVLSLLLIFLTRSVMLCIREKMKGMDEKNFKKVRGWVLWGFLAFAVMYCLIITLLITNVRGFNRYTNDTRTIYQIILYYNRIDLMLIAYVIPLFLALFTIMFEFDKEHNSHLIALTEETKQEKKKAIESKNKADMLTADLLTNVTHDLKTPLTAIIGYVALMEKEELSPVMKDYVKAVSDKSVLLKEMIEKVFEISKASSGNVKLELTTLNMNKLVNQLISDVRDTYKDRELNIKCKLSEGNTDFVADSIYAYRIVQNLLVNAVKYSLEGTRIFVNTYEYPDSVALEIVNVSSYPLEVGAEDLKEKFVRADKSRNTEGNGLGLAIVESYVNALNGTFSIDLIGDTFKTVVKLNK